MIFNTKVSEHTCSHIKYPWCNAYRINELVDIWVLHTRLLYIHIVKLSMRIFQMGSVYQMTIIYKVIRTSFIDRIIRLTKCWWVAEFRCSHFLTKLLPTIIIIIGLNLNIHTRCSQLYFTEPFAYLKCLRAFHSTTYKWIAVRSGNVCLYSLLVCQSWLYGPS